MNTSLPGSAGEGAGVNQAPAPSFVPPAPVASDEPGAWLCKRCGFRGFWYGGLHCDAELLPQARGNWAPYAAKCAGVLL